MIVEELFRKKGETGRRGEETRTDEGIEESKEALGGRLAFLSLVCGVEEEVEEGVVFKCVIEKFEDLEDLLEDREEALRNLTAEEGRVLVQNGRDRVDEGGADPCGAEEDVQRFVGVLLDALADDSNCTQHRCALDSLSRVHRGANRRNSATAPRWIRGNNLQDTKALLHEGCCEDLAVV